MKKFVLALCLLLAFVFFASCNPENEEDTEDIESTDATKPKVNITKIIKDENTVKTEETFEIVQNGKPLNLYISEYNRDFRDLYDDNSYIKYFDYENSFLPYVEIESKFDENNVFYKIKGYQRKTYSTDENGNKKVVEDTFVNRTVHTFFITATNSNDEDICFENLPMLTVIYEDDIGNEYFNTNTYSNENGETEFSMTPVYLEPSDNPQADNYDDYLKTTLKAKSDNEITLKYVLDNDLYTSAYLCFQSENGNKYFKLY